METIIYSSSNLLISVSERDASFVLPSHLHPLHIML